MTYSMVGSHETCIDVIRFSKMCVTFWASQVAQLVKNLPAIQETWVRSLGWEDPMEKGRLPTPVFWPGKFHGLHSLWCLKESDTTEQLSHGYTW